MTFAGVADIDFTSDQSNACALIAHLGTVSIVV